MIPNALVAITTTDAQGNINPLAVSNFPALQAVSGFPVNKDLSALVTLAASGASGTSADFSNTNGRGIQIGVNISAISGLTAALLVTLQGKDVASGQYYTLLASLGLTVTGFTLMTIYPGVPITANVSMPQVLPATYRISYTVTGTTPSITATIGGSLII